MSGLIGFGVVFLLVCGASSAALTALVVACRRPLARVGPAVEQRAAQLAATLPIAFGAAVLAVLAIESLLGVDHCTTHGDHAHLCLQHGAAWATNTAAIVALAGGGALVVLRGAALTARLWRGRIAISRLQMLGTATSERVRVVESDRAFCFVAGVWRPAIFVSTRTREVLDRDEWDAMLAHETSHVEHRDLLHRFRLELLLLFAAPFAGAAIRAQWNTATERLRDADAADAVGDPAPVASALVRMARCAAELRTEVVAAFTGSKPRLLAARVEALLGGGPRGDREAAWIARIALAGSVAAIGLVLAFAGSVHHTLESLLG